MTVGMSEFLKISDSQSHPSPREYALSLMRKKEVIEEELKVLEAFLNGTTPNTQTNSSPDESELKSPANVPPSLITSVEDSSIFTGAGSGGVGMHGPLVDSQGFPRADIDLVAVRMARQKVTMLLNDHKDLMKTIEKALQQVYSPIQSDTVVETTTSPNIPLSPPNTTASATKVAPQEPPSSVGLQKPFRKQGAPYILLNAVHPDGPAAAAGLQRNDLIVRFGDFIVTEKESGQDLLNRFNEYVRTMENSPVSVFYERPRDSSSTSTLSEVTMTCVIPKSWSGKGLLGCHLVAL